MRFTVKLVLIGSCALLVFLALSSAGLGTTPPQKTAAPVAVNANVAEFIAVQVPGPVTLLDPNGQPITGDNDNATGSGSWNIKTNDNSGYVASIFTSGAPAMSDGAGNSFADYSQGSAVPWSLGNGQTGFGFSVDGTNYQGFQGSKALQIASSNVKSVDSGDNVTVDFEAGVGPNKIQSAGAYSAGVTLTAVGN